MMFQRPWCHYQLKREITEFEVIERDNELNKQFHLSGCMFGESAYAYFLPKGDASSRFDCLMHVKCSSYGTKGF